MPEIDATRDPRYIREFLDKSRRLQDAQSLRGTAARETEKFREQRFKQWQAYRLQRSDPEWREAQIEEYARREQEKLARRRAAALSEAEARVTALKEAS